MIVMPLGYLRRPHQLLILSSCRVYIFITTSLVLCYRRQNNAYNVANGNTEIASALLDSLWTAVQQTGKLETMQTHTPITCPDPRTLPKTLGTSVLVELTNETFGPVKCYSRAVFFKTNKPTDATKYKKIVTA